MKTHRLVTGFLISFLLFPLSGTRLLLPDGRAQEKPSSEPLVYEADVIWMENKKMEDGERLAFAKAHRMVEADSKTGDWFRITEKSDEYVRVSERRAGKFSVKEERSGKPPFRFSFDEKDADKVKPLMNAFGFKGGKLKRLKDREKIEGIECAVEVTTMEVGGEKMEARTWVPLDKRLEKALGSLQQCYYRLDNGGATLFLAFRLSNIRLPDK